VRKLVQVIGVALFATTVAGLLATTASGRVMDRPGPATEARAAELERELGPGVRVEVHRETGRVRFIGTEPGRPIPRPPGLGPDAAPAAVARAFLDSVGPELGLKRGSEDLRATGSAGEGGDTAVRFQQLVDGVPVMAGELVVAVDARGRVLSAIGELEPDGVDTSAEVSAAAARRVALASVAKGAGASVEELETGAPSLAIYDPRLLGGPGLGVPLLVWRTEVRSTADRALRRLVLVDAKLGLVAESLDLIREAKDRRVCDAGNTAADYPCTSPYDREEGDGATGNADVDAAYDFAGDTYDFFFDRFGYDSLDGAGLPLVSTVRYCPAGEACPYANAFWDGSQMVYGEGFAAADDVVGHELSHGFTQFNSNLFYWYQSGAINESMSDVFGELVDLTNEAGDDSASARWLLGEDVPGFGALRDMQNPPAFGDPDRMTSANYVADIDQFDNGGVHTNSGVNNKAAYLIVDGDSFNGESVAGIGVDKAARVYFAANSSLLTSGSDYADLHQALRQACVNSVGGAEGITEADCEQVAKAVDATEMDMDPLVGAAPEAPVCAAGGEAVDLFHDDLEKPGSGNWAHSASAGADRWYHPQNSHPFEGFDATYATSGETNFWGYDQPAAADFSIAQTADLAIPAGAVYLRFNHSYAFEDYEDEFSFDGGQLEYSVDGGSSWQDAESLFTHNGYNGTIASGFENPLAGQAAFTADSHGYISSRVDLSSLAGEEVRFRFRIGTDESVDDYGWFVDDIRIYECEAIEPPPPDETPPETTLVSGPAQGSTTSDPTPTFAFASDEEPVSFECSLDAGPFAPCSSPHTTAPLADSPHSFAVRATDAAENTDPSPAMRAFTVETPPGGEEPPPPLPTPTPAPMSAPTSGTPSTLSVDRRAPRTVLLGRRWQIAGRPVAMRARCDEACGAVIRGRAVLWRKARSGIRVHATAAARRQVRIGLRKVTRSLAAGRTGTFKLRPKSRRAARRLGRMVRSGWKARVVVVARFRDRAGNPAVERTVIRLRSPRR